MALVPISYNLRSMWVRRSATLLTVLGLGATVAVIVGILALRQGFASLYQESGQPDVAVFLRAGAIRETESWFTRELANVLIKSAPEIAAGPNGQPLASGEVTLALRLRKLDGGEANVPIRGVQPATFEIRGDALAIGAGRRFEFGSDEVLVGKRLLDRLQDSQVGDTLVINVTPFRVVGTLESEGPEESEIWGDLERISAALGREGFNRVIAKLREGESPKAMTARLEHDPQTPAKVLSEPDFLAGQSTLLSGALVGLVGFLGLVMGVAAVFTATNTMLAALSARAKDIGILKAIGFRPFPIFVSFLLESLVLGLLGGLAGALMAMPLNGVETGTTNWDTFTEVAFAFRVTPSVLATAIVYAMALGLVGGAWPAWRATRLTPTEALRRG